MDLKKVKSSDLLDELASRSGVEKSASGTFAPYSLKERYSNSREKEIDVEVLLIIKRQSHLDA